MNKPSPEELELLHNDLCSALNDKTRIAILFELAEGPRHVTSIVQALELPQGTVSRHLRVLRESGVVAASREANRVVYELQDLRILDVLNLLRQMLASTFERRGEAARRIRAGSGPAARPGGAKSKGGSSNTGDL